MKIMVVGAHVDDIEGMMGGTLALLARAGHDITAVVAFSHREGKRFYGRCHSDVRVEEAARSFALISLPPPTIFKNLCGDFSCLSTLRDDIAEIIKDKNPDAVFTHWPGDLHGDHQITSIAVKDACLNTSPTRCDELIYCETCPNMFDYKSRGPDEQHLTVRSYPIPRSHLFRPTHWVDIRTTASLKKNMLYEMQSQDGKRLWEEHEAKWVRRAEYFPEFCSIAYNEVFARVSYKELQTVLVDCMIPVSIEAAGDWWPR